MILFLPVDAVGCGKPPCGAPGGGPQGPAGHFGARYRGAKGNLLWIPPALRATCWLAADARVDEWARPRAHELEVDDPAVLRNINTPEEWAAMAAQTGGAEA